MNNKSRILFLLDYLRRNTDEVTPVSAAQLRREFRAHGMNATPTTLRDDIATLRESGFEIVSEEENGVATWYKFVDLDWDPTEVQILVDAVASSQFISKEKSNLLIGRLSTLLGPGERKKLGAGIRVEDQVKARNEKVLLTITNIRRAISTDRRIRFMHNEYIPELDKDQKLKQKPKHGGYVYEVSPYATIWKQDRYYLVGWSEKHGSVANFRIDRMEVPEVTEEPRRPAPKDLKLEDNSDKIFSMFDGPEAEITLRFRPKLLDQIVDRFGAELELKNINEESIDVTVTVHLSPTFYAWLFQYAGEMKIVEPEGIREEYAERLQTALDDALAD